jgi:hypothetical protein
MPECQVEKSQTNNIQFILDCEFSAHVERHVHQLAPISDHDYESVISSIMCCHCVKWKFMTFRAITLSKFERARAKTTRRRRHTLVE